MRAVVPALLDLALDPEVVNRQDEDRGGGGGGGEGGGRRGRSGSRSGSFAGEEEALPPRPVLSDTAAVANVKAQLM